MKFEASVIPLVFMFTLVAGDADKYSRVTRTPQPVKDRQNRLYYPCRFDFIARCTWEVNEKSISISEYGYTWMSGNGSNTNDCSIESRSLYTPQLSDDPKGDKVDCIGIGNGPVKVLIGHSIRLQCPGNNRRNCVWIRYNQQIEINGRYQFSKDRDYCSIRINETQHVDLTQWRCYNRNEPEWPRAVYTLAQLNQTEEQTAYPTSEAVERDLHTTATSRDTTVQSPTNNSTLKSPDETNATTSTTIQVSANLSEEATTSVDQPNETVPTVMMTTIIILSTLVTICAIWIIRERIKKRNMANIDNNEHNRDGGVREAPSSTSNAHHSYGHGKASISQSETEDDDGYLMATQLSENTKPANSPKRNSDPKNHVYQTIKDDIYTNVEHPTGNSPTYTVLF